MKKKIILIFLLIAAAIIGSIIATACDGVTYFNWLSYAKSVGVQPFTLDIVSINLTFGLNFSLSVAQIICFIIAFFIYPKIVSRLDV
ncbi:MAG: DUF4321 domain-containing protein [Clostridiales bacterium]|jgi:hypothetical protein|nr:DUF4321 domain-containing protein [Clostridiales bacterium]